MLTWRNGHCPCHAGYSTQRIYLWHGLGYCIDCLHTIGINAAGNYCTDAQQGEGWRNLNRSDAD